MVLTTRSVTCGSPRPPPRAGTRLSSSSMKMIVGATWRPLAHRRRLDSLQRIVEVPELDRQSIEDFVGDRLLVEVDPRHDPPNRLERGLAHQRGKVGADEAVGAPRQIVEVHVWGERHSAR